MPESDVTKMKDRLQTALLEGDISLEDSAIADAIDDDVSLTDEDEHKLLGDDHEDLLLKSPVSTPTATTIPELSLHTAAGSDSPSEASNASLPAKKIVLKRNNSHPLATAVTTTTIMTSKENAAPEATDSTPGASELEEKPTKTQRKPIVVGGAATKSKDAATLADKKLSELSIQERLEMRAKKFGITPETKAAAAPSAATVPTVNKSSPASIKANKGNKETDEQQKEALKRRAERFGCVVPEKSPKTVTDDRLQKRKERFGATVGTSTAASDPKGQGEWAEKARARLERFKTTPAAVADATK
ncbi:SAP domain-containing ribonucleoprotein isoform X2 [Drosophila virilis]|uniref:Uncharacterized protein, isoform B n=1 Tax=Drosophila virilis TaxID=7244 RepID=A0A0Q9WEW9_DROVI|nr:SAP domain-containing ribonucleoprotein isoform X2 [Drosophila virilis]KRF82986.1 uncharacterized protein Dvir_GJ23370, isoform B [Drosophila virilis]